jgi:tRNA pseudouridine55 synthase
MIHGILNVYKEKGFTSHDVVAKLRGILRQKKIGHTGTLDPDAEGVLPVCLGKATKVCDLLTEKDKMYEALLLLGVMTDTQDTSGQVLEERDTSSLDLERVKEVISSYEGAYEQVPPMYSALKVNGKKLYELAREGKVVERKARPVTIHSIEILEIDLPRVRMKVHCSKGTYIRTLCHDIGQDLGVGGCMESLLRTQVSRFRLDESKTLDEIARYQEEGRLVEVLLPLDFVFEDVPKGVVQEKFRLFAYHGNPLQTAWVDAKEDTNRIRIYDAQGTFIGIYRLDDQQKSYRLEKMFLTEEQLRRT